MLNRQALLTEANQAATDARDRAGLDLIAPVDIYALAESLGTKVRFLDVSMEGFYQRGNPARIMLSSLRPLARRAFTCAHELGHHWFGHGSRVDELQADERHESKIPEEILANGFASFVLMPTIGVRGAFSRRGWSIKTADPLQILTIASEFGVGYSTLITHFAMTVRDISSARRTELEKWTPQRIRKHLLGNHELEGLVILDEHQQAASIDLEIGYGLTLPLDADIEGDCLEHIHSYASFDLYRAAKRGRVSIKAGNWSAEARVAPTEFIGPAGYRFLEDPDDETA